MAKQKHELMLTFDIRTQTVRESETPIPREARREWGDS